MAHILAFSFFPAHLPPRSGGEMRLFSLYEALSRHHRVTLLTSGHLGGTTQILEHNARFREIRVPKGPEFAETWARLTPHAGSGDLSGPCLSACALSPNALLEAYLDVHAEADLIIHDSPFTVNYDLFIGHDGKPRIYNSYNVEYDLYSKIHADAGSDFIPNLVRDAEQDLIRNSSLITGCTDDDLKRFRDLYEDVPSAILVPNGIDEFTLPKVKLASNRLIFIGSAHHPNRAAAALICDLLAPALPSYEFHILGNCLDRGRPVANVISHGLVDEAEKKHLMAGALACVNPMLEGGGSSLKVPDMAANGVPLISTPLGARGFGLVAGKHYLPIAPDNLIETVRNALANPDALSVQAANAARHFKRHYTWPKISQKFAEAIDKLLSDAPSSPAPAVLVLNDYDPFATIGGGSTRIRGLYEGASTSVRPILLTFTEGDTIVRREVFGGKGLAISVPKTAEHRQRDAAQASEFHVSTVDLVAMEFAPLNPLLSAIQRAAANFTGIVASEHPYMASLLLDGSGKFVYSSQNCESALKHQLLQYHPRARELLSAVEKIERFCIGCSELVVAVSHNDAATFAANNDLLAPLVVIENGAEEPIMPANPVAQMSGFNVCFLGSGHLPNYMAVRWLLDEICHTLPEVTFHIAGSVCDGFDAVPENVVLHGFLDDSAKTQLLLGCQMALNPMAEGSGSNIKLADYLMHGLPVLSTAFGVRGYDGIGVDDIEIAELGDFAAAITRCAERPRFATDRDARRKRFSQRYSMRVLGVQYGAMLADMVRPRKRALFVTYRYNEPPRGGGEVYVNKLINYLAAADVAVDVLTPKVDVIADVDRFGSSFPVNGDAYPVPFGHPLIRVAKFDAAPVPQQADAVRRIWQEQPDFEASLGNALKQVARSTALLWGWGANEADGRWTMNRFAMQAAAARLWRLTGSAPGKRYVIIRGSDGASLSSLYLDGDFEFEFNAPKGIVSVEVFRIANDEIEDPRPLGLFVKGIWCAGKSLLEEVAVASSQQVVEPPVLFSALHAAAVGTRFAAGTLLADARGPFAPQLEDYLKEHARDYDLVITHNAVFRTASKAIKAANDAGVPSVIVPHAHFEDDYYHFPDVLDAIRNATRALITPKVACDFMKGIGADNVAFLSPGIDCLETFSDEDCAAFRKVHRRGTPFVLIVGRKAISKGYRDTISAVAALRAGAWPDLRIVMIGPDDDGLAITESFVDYLGPVDRSVLRGAYRSCSVVVNMSRSESFGIVLLEAGLASRPVIANATCPAFAELVSDGENGFLAAPSSLPDRLSEIFGKPALAKSMGQNGRQRALAFSWDEIGKKFVQHCHELISMRTSQ